MTSPPAPPSRPRLSPAREAEIAAKVAAADDGARFDVTIGLDGRNHAEDLRSLLAELSALREERDIAIAQRGEARAALQTASGLAYERAAERAGAHAKAWKARFDDTGLMAHGMASDVASSIAADIRALAAPEQEEPKR